MSTMQQSQAGRDLPAGRRPRRWRLPAAVLGVVVAVLAVHQYVAEVQRVGSASMSPTLCTGDVLVVRHLGRGTPADGDVITFRSPGNGTVNVKRVVGTAGQEVRLIDGRLVVDGRRVAEPYVTQATIDGVYFGPVTVPSGAVFVMGDDREISIDSRSFGPVPLDAVQGEVAARLTHGDCPLH